MRNPNPHPHPSASSNPSPHPHPHPHPHPNPHEVRREAAIDRARAAEAERMSSHIRWELDEP
jgi:hypothetical protein